MNVTERDRLPTLLNDLFLMGLMLAMAGILTVAMIFQYYLGEIPCPLCLLQRVAMSGVCFGIILHFRHGHSARNDGFCMLFAILLLIVSARQTLIDIYPRPGHSYIGSAVFGLHMPVWSIVIAVAIRRWHRPDRHFFANGACQVLAFAFLERYPDIGFRARWIKPAAGFTGNHIYVTDGINAFDYHGLTSEQRLLAFGFKRGPGQFFHDALPRARSFLERFGI